MATIIVDAEKVHVENHGMVTTQTIDTATLVRRNEAETVVQKGNSHYYCLRNKIDQKFKKRKCK